MRIQHSKYKLINVTEGAIKFRTQTYTQTSILMLKVTDKTNSTLTHT